MSKCNNFVHIKVILSLCSPPIQKDKEEQKEKIGKLGRPLYKCMFNTESESITLASAQRPQLGTPEFETTHASLY